MPVKSWAPGFCGSWRRSKPPSCQATQASSSERATSFAIAARLLRISTLTTAKEGKLLSPQIILKSGLLQGVFFVQFFVPSGARKTQIPRALTCFRQFFVAFFGPLLCIAFVCLSFPSTGRKEKFPAGHDQKGIGGGL